MTCIRSVERSFMTASSAPLMRTAEISRKTAETDIVLAINLDGSGKAARGTGGALQPTQSGKVNLYGALLFGAAAVGALVLVLVNS